MFEYLVKAHMDYLSELQMWKGWEMELSGPSLFSQCGACTFEGLQILPAFFFPLFMTSHEKILVLV